MSAKIGTPAIEEQDVMSVVGTDAIADEIRVVQSVQAQGNMPVLLAGNMFAIAIILYIGWNAAIVSHTIYLLIAVGALLLPMLRSYLNLRRRPRPERVSRRRIRLLEIHSLLLGMVWAIAIFMIVPELNPMNGMIVGFIMFYMGFAGVALMPSLPKATAAYICPVFFATFTSLFINEILGAGLLILLWLAGVVSLGRTSWLSWRDAKASVTMRLEKLHAEAEIHRRETEAMRSLLNAIPFPLVVTQGTSALHASDQAYRQFGVQSGNVSDFQLAEFFVHPHQRDEVAEILHKHGRLEEFELHLKNIRGERFWVSLSTLPLKYEGKDCWLNAIYVIDERKRTEEVLAEKEAQLRLVMDHMQGGIRLVDKDRNYVFFNQQYLDHYDFPDNLLKVGESNRVENLHQAERGDFGPGNPGSLTEQWLSELPVQIEKTSWERTTVFGKTLSVQTSPTPDGGVVNIVTDITESKRAEAELQDAYAIISASVDYASNIQRAALPFDELMLNAFDDHFVIWEPRDVVGGDMYWLIPVPDGFVLGVADCTGHGVPGAFVTLLASGALRHALSENPAGDPATLIARINRFIKEVLSQYTHDSVSNDGLEIGLCRIDTFNRTMTYAGARFSLWEFREGDIREIRGDKTGIGYKDVPINLTLTNYKLDNCRDAAYYLFSDGFDDQIGGAKGRALGKRRILDCLLKNRNETFQDQAKKIMRLFREHQGTQLRRDDLTMIGFRL